MLSFLATNSVASPFAISMLLLQPLPVSGLQLKTDVVLLGHKQRGLALRHLNAPFTLLNAILSGCNGRVSVGIQIFLLLLHLLLEVCRHVGAKFLDGNTIHREHHETTPELMLKDIVLLRDQECDEPSSEE